MVIGKIKPTATIVAQYAAGVEIEAIQHEGKMYLPIVGMGEFAASDDAPTKTKAKKDEPTPEVEEETSAKALYTKEELMEMDTKEMVKILKKEFDVNPDDFDGKNTNKKLRDLILDAQKESKKSSEEDEEAPTPKKGKKSPAKSADDGEDEKDGDGADLIEQVGDLLEEFDGGKKNKKKTIAAIVTLSDDADEDKVTELVEAFEDDADADIDEVAEKIANVLEGKKPAKKGKKEKAAPAPKKGKKAKENLVEPEDLEVGDRVSVYWDDENQEWYDGEVKSTKKGKIVIAYDDETEDEIDPEVHTKIKRLAE